MNSEKIEKDPILLMADCEFLAKLGNKESEAKLKDLIIENKAVSYLRRVKETFNWNDVTDKEAALSKVVAEELEKIEATIKDAKENLGENEVREALLARGEFYKKITEFDRALECYEETLQVTVGMGQKLDILFSILRIGLYKKDLPLVATNITRAKALIDKGGDWERRNRLKVYEATYLTSKRSIKEASVMFLDALATFSATELINNHEFIFFTIVISIITVDRPTLCSKVASAPEILTCIHEIPSLDKFLNALVACDYETYMKNLPDLLVHLRNNRYIHEHTNYIGRELRVVAYGQFLTAYQSVTLQAMSAAFGMSVEFIDAELFRFISSGRLNCKIDRVEGTIQATRPDAKNALYLNTIKQGDALLNRIQKLSRVIDM